MAAIAGIDLGYDSACGDGISEEDFAHCGSPLLQ